MKPDNEFLIYSRTTSNPSSQKGLCWNRYKKVQESTIPPKTPRKSMKNPSFPYSSSLETTTPSVQSGAKHATNQCNRVRTGTMKYNSIFCAAARKLSTLNSLARWMRSYPHRAQLSTVLAFLLLSACSTTRHLKPGHSVLHSGTATNGLPEFRSEMKQPENPAQAAAQHYEKTTETELPLTRGSKVTEVVQTQDDLGRPIVKEKTILLSEPVIQKTKQIEKAGTTIGASQKDTAREIGAKLASLKSVVWVGVLLFIFGLASLFYPPLKVIVGSVTTSLAMLGGGVALISLPSLVAGNELFLLGSVAITVGGWFLAHRHGELRGIVSFKHQASASKNAQSK